MPGALVGGSYPSVSIILDQVSRKWTMNVQLNRAFALGSNENYDKIYRYEILVPRKVGCNFELFKNMSNDKTDFDYNAAFGDIVVETVNNQGTPVWNALTNDYQINAYLQLTTNSNVEETVGCFTKYTLEVIIRDSLALCNVSFCIIGDLFVQCEQLTEGCDKFPVYITLKNDGLQYDGTPGTTDGALDESNRTTVANPVPQF